MAYWGPDSPPDEPEAEEVKCACCGHFSPADCMCEDEWGFFGKVGESICKECVEARIVELKALPESKLTEDQDCALCELPYINWQRISDKYWEGVRESCSCGYDD